MSIPILAAQAVHKTYPSGDRRIDVLKGVDLEIRAGESVSIRGESGSGKSTLLNLFAGLDAPDSGVMTWEAQTTLDSSKRARLLGIVFQSFYLIPEIDARANVLMAARVLGKVSKLERERADYLLNKVGLGERGHHLPAHLSGGERQRVAVARALMNQPKLILADEPTGNLDEQTGELVIDMLLGLCKESSTALLLVTHNAAHASRVDRQLVLKDGHLRSVQEAAAAL